MLNKNSIAVLVAAGAISSAAIANPTLLSQELLRLDRKATANIQSILQNPQATESEKIIQIGNVMKRIEFAKEVQAMRLKTTEESARSVGQGMTCGDYNL